MNEPVFCRHCGRRLTPGVAVCAACGFDNGPSAAPPARRHGAALLHPALAAAAAAVLLVNLILAAAGAYRLDAAAPPASADTGGSLVGRDVNAVLAEKGADYAARLRVTGGAFSTEYAKDTILTQRENAEGLQEITLSLGPQPVWIEDYTGFLASALEEQLNAAGVWLVIRYTVDETSAKGTVLTQDVPAGSLLYAGDNLSVTVAWPAAEPTPTARPRPTAMPRPAGTRQETAPAAGTAPQTAGQTGTGGGTNTGGSGGGTNTAGGHSGASTAAGSPSAGTPSSSTSTAGGSSHTAPADSTGTAGTPPRQSPAPAGSTAADSTTSRPAPSQPAERPADSTGQPAPSVDGNGGLQGNVDGVTLPGTGETTDPALQPDAGTGETPAGETIPPDTGSGTPPAADTNPAPPETGTDLTPPAAGGNASPPETGEALQTPAAARSGLTLRPLTARTDAPAVTLAELAGLDVAGMKQYLQTRQLLLVVDGYTGSDTVPAGQAAAVNSQQDGILHVQLSRGPEVRLAVPNILGMDRAAARQALTRAGFTQVIWVDPPADSEAWARMFASGAVCGTSEAMGAFARADAPLTVFVADSGSNT